MAPDPRDFHGLNPGRHQVAAAQASPMPQPAHLPISEEFVDTKESTMEHDPASCFCAALDVRPEGGAGVMKGKGRAALLKATHWGDHRQLTVGFYGGSDAVRQRVVRHAQEWTRSGAGVKFHFWASTNADPATADIRVSFVQNGRSWSYLGTDARRPELRGKPTMNLGWLTESLSEERARAVILHEFGHALGLIHEHQNPHDQIDWDTDAVIADLSGPPNNWDRQTILSNMFKAYDTAALVATDVDENSIMMYPIKASWTKSGFSVGFNSQLSEHDKSLIKAAYPPLGLG
jgi:serralysin